jgi:hypothetical protein
MEFKFYLHSQLPKIYLDQIIDLKKIHWDYSRVEHENWIKSNLKDNDLHVLMLEGDILVGYLNLIRTNILINNILNPFLGVGNVCSREKGRGYGKKLLVEINNYLITNKYHGVLLCKDKLIEFYKKSNWLLISKNLTEKSFESKINVMLFNYNLKIQSFIYTGCNF